MLDNFSLENVKEYGPNLSFRTVIREKCQYDEGLRRDVMAYCRQDVLFFFNVFCWLYEPRIRRDPDTGNILPKQIPFITWSHQDPVIEEIREYLGICDIGIEKSRGEGASWILVLMALHDFLFNPMTAIGMVSRTEDAVDSPEDPDSLFWKIDWQLTQLPKWMTPNYKRHLQDHTFRNLDIDCTIAGYSCTGDVASGGRKTWFGMDELAKFPRGPDYESMASTQHVTDSRFFVSTPKGSTGAYYDLMHEPSPNMRRLTLDWKANPWRNRGLYRMVNGTPEALDPKDNPLPATYDPPNEDVVDLFSQLRARGFKVDGSIRSPWYDNECARPMATPQNIAQELDRDYGGSAFRVFGHEPIDKMEETVRDPKLRGQLQFHPETLKPRWQTIENGPFKIWCQLEKSQNAAGNTILRPPKHRYVIGADVGSGTGGSFTSNSALIVFDLTAGEQVGEYASNTILPRDFADLCMAAAFFFNRAYLIWEHGGPGVSMTDRVREKRYSPVYRRKLKYKTVEKSTKDLGWWTNADTKVTMFNDAIDYISSGQVVIRSRELKTEYEQYVWIQGKIEHSKAVSTEDDSGKGKAHGDRAIAGCVAIQYFKQIPKSSRTAQEERTENPLVSTLAGREADWAKRQAQAANSLEWDDRSNGDLANPGIHQPWQNDGEDW